ncbi:hypothetical protein GCM10027275_48570 [Rhabdobacter roseus]|uniref:Uncharacterized protein n=1 Tax=Rhabdobacter roseus TaxID=1655419 RepID=A0A840U499_9BACT|nr:hypothetical protein [Rhabdobacter roseus]MBB5286920.1 hypothetical protein [Rhabdobacter roseus]
MRLPVPYSILVFCCFLSASLRAQDHYDPARALSNEELLLKKDPTNRVFTKAGQRYLALDVSPFWGGFHRHRFFPGDDMRFRLKDESIKFNETLASVSDSTFSIVIINDVLERMEYREIPLTQVHRIKVFRRIPWVTEGAFLLPLAGLIYIGADFFNKGIDDQRFTTDRQTLAVGGALVGTGIICYKLSFSSLRINKNNRLKVLQTY